MFIKDNEAIVGKIEELCAVLLEQDDYRELKAHIDRYNDNEEARAQYERFLELDEGSEAYEQEERAVYANEVIRKYLFAEKEFGHLKDTLNDYFTKTIDYGRLPESKELKRVIRGCGSHRT